MAEDPYRYFRVEARELLDGLGAGVLQLEKGSAPDVVARLLRFAHTLKGAARVVKQPAVAESAHALESILAVHREGGGPLTREQVTDALRLLDEMTSRLRDLGAAPAVAVAVDPPRAAEAARAAVPAPEEAPLETLRVDIHEMDALLRGVTEVGVRLGSLQRGLGAAEHVRGLAAVLLERLTVRSGDGDRDATTSAVARARSLAEELSSGLERLQRDLAVDVEHIDRELRDVRDVAHRLRLVPAHSVFPFLDRAARDAAHALGKKVELETSGGDVRLDANVLASVRDALAHVVRNAVTHGIERPADRLRAGKLAAGHVRIRVERRGTRAAFVCEDDGRGVDLDAVKRAAVARGLVSPSETLSPDRVLDLLRAGGLSTTSEITELSGRGIGLDVVRATTSRLKGEFSLRSVLGQGATVEIQVPVSVASLHALVVEAAGSLAAISLDAVRATIRLREGDVARAGDRESILHDGKVIPLLALDVALRLPRVGRASSRSLSAVVVAGTNHDVAIAVDRLLGTQAIVMRSLPSLVAADPVVAGASLDAEGNPQLVLDPAGLVAAAAHDYGATRAAVPAPRLPILVIDDSLTTRMLEQSILESAGYEVDLAVSAEEALGKARERRYGVFIVDVEMPGMDGFEFVTRTRADAALRDTPAILVTSRNAPEDRRRGEQAGAYAYVVKSEFDQGRLLQMIRTLVG